MSDFFMNQRINLVKDMLDGILRISSSTDIARLDTDGSINIIVNKNKNSSCVALISGGGSGHEPAHAGFVGEGMLTAAVCGDVFASPSVDAVLSAIINVTGPEGCLLIVKNYTGDRLNFGLAAEKARKLGFNVEMVIVKDDISLTDNPQPRGIAGTILVHKIAGFAAQQGRPLKDVKAVAEHTASRLASLGVAFTACRVPGENNINRVKPGTCELGMGIHGEPGVETLNTQNSKTLVDLMTTKLLASLKHPQPVALMINNLGGLSNLEMGILTGLVLRSPLGQCVKYVVGPDTLVTALDMKGFSLTLLPLDEENEPALLAPVNVPGWPRVITPSEPVVYEVSRQLPLLSCTPSENNVTQHIVTTACQALINAEKELNDLDRLVGDGDTGTTFANGARKILSSLNDKQLPLDDTERLLSVIGEQLSVAMGGSSGVLLSILFTAAGQHITEGHSLAHALLHGLNKMQHYGGARVGDRTMVDALTPALNCFVKDNDINCIAIAAKQGADSTINMPKAKAGRSSYINSQALQGVKDPGAFAVEYLFSMLASEPLSHQALH